MEKLENYILNNVTIKEDIEYPLITFRIISNAGELGKHIENIVIKNKPIFQEIIVEKLETILGTFTMLAMTYVSQATYEETLKNLIIYKPQDKSQLQLTSLLYTINNIVATGSEMINSLGDKNENEFYVSQLCLDGIKQCYSLAELMGLDINKLRESIYKKREVILVSTTGIINNINKPTLTDGKGYHTTVDILINQGKYEGITILKDTIEDGVFNTGDIVKDFFTCTKELRDKKEYYTYSGKLFDFLQTEDNLTQAYINKGKLFFRSSFDDKAMEKYMADETAFEAEFHHILVRPDIQSMDDFLDYLYL